MKKHHILVITIVLLTIASCKPKGETISGFFDYYDYETECLSIDRNGTQTVKAWGLGRTEKEAILNARRRALDDIIFNGLRGNTDGCIERPIVSNPNIRRQQEMYFYQFFRENGAFESYVSLPEDDQTRSKRNLNDINKDNRAYEIIVKVDVMALKNHLRKDQIIQ